MAKSKNALMQWMKVRGSFLLAGNDAQEASLISDPQFVMTFPGRLLRLILTLNFRGLGLFTTAGEDIMSVGLYRASPVAAFGSCSSLLPANADMPWLYRQAYRLPQQANGWFNVEGDPYHLDWRIHGGNGTNINKDVDIRLNFSTPNFQAGQLNVSFDALALLIGE